MAPRIPEEEEVTAEHAQSLLEKSDRLAREYAREKEVKQRGDRVRRAESTQASIRPVSAESAEAPTRVRDLPRRTSGETGARRREHVPAERAPGPQAPQSPRLRPADAAPAERQALPTRQPPPRAGEGSPVQLRPDSAGGTSALDRLAVELEELLRELSFGWRALRLPDRITVGCALSMVVGVFFPWVSDPAHAGQAGLQAGGTLHLAIGGLALWVVVRSHGMRGLRMSRRDETMRYRRYSLWLVLLGAGSTLAGAYLLLMNGLHRGPEWPVQVHFGLYWTLVAGTGLSYGGYARFADAPR